MVEAAQLAEGFQALRGGQHVCWFPDGPTAYAAGAETFAAQARSVGDRVLIIGAKPVGLSTWCGDATIIDPFESPASSHNARAPWELVPRHVRGLGSDSAGSLRVLAKMAHLMPPGRRFDELAALELGWGHWAAGHGASVVCAYPRDAWDESTLRDLACMHSGQLGTSRLAASFRMTCVEPGWWKVDGVVDFVAAGAFGVAVRAALARGGTVGLRFDGVEMIDAAGIDELVRATRESRGGVVRVEGANPTVRRLWQLSGFGVTTEAVDFA